MGKGRQAGRVARAIARAFDEAKRTRPTKRRASNGHAKPSGRGTVFYDVTMTPDGRLVSNPREVAPGLQIPPEVEKRVGEIRLRKLTAPIIARLEEDYRKQGR